MIGGYAEVKEPDVFLHQRERARHRCSQDKGSMVDMSVVGSRNTRKSRVCVAIPKRSNIFDESMGVTLFSYY